MEAFQLQKALFLDNPECLKVLFFFKNCNQAQLVWKPVWLLSDKDMHTRQLHS